MRKPWFRSSQSGVWWVPASLGGWAVCGAFVIAVLSCNLLPVEYRPPALVGLGMAYMAISLWFSRTD